MPTSDGAGVKLNRVIGTPKLDLLDPYLMLDEFGSDDPDAYIAGFPSHPHRGCETITYMIAGRMRHKDSRGNEGVLSPGDVQWMTTARGLIHSEMPEQTEGRMQGFQIWLNLPAAEKMLEPKYADIPAASIPKARSGQHEIVVIAGQFADQTGPITSPSTMPVIMDLHLDGMVPLELPIPFGHALSAYVYEGQAIADDRLILKGQIAVFESGSILKIEARTPTAKILILGGKPLKEPIARYGPFVMNKPEEIQQAFADYQAGTLY